MVIQCVNCSKKFDVNSSLIPENGRTIQCGSCNHTWFYKPTIEKTFHILNDNDDREQSQTTKIVKKKKNLKNLEKKDKIKKKEVLISKDISKNVEVEKNFVETKEIPSKFNPIKILDYFIVTIISFIGIIILFDTFKSPLSNIYPDLELVLYNLYESIKDIFLFIKDLFI